VDVMNWVPVIWSVWGASVLLMAIVILCASRLAKDEEDQLFLADSSSHERKEQASIAMKVEKIKPLKKSAGIFVGMTTLGVLVYYIFDVIHQLR
jgi:hypothetical protein